MNQRLMHTWEKVFYYIFVVASAWGLWIIKLAVKKALAEMTEK